MMFGYASNETDTLIPTPIFYSHKLMKQQAFIRKKGILPWLRPDAKSQITFIYEDYKPIAIDTIVLSTQHSPDISHGDLTEAVIDLIIKPVIPEHWITPNTRFLVNPTGRF